MTDVTQQLADALRGVIRVANRKTAEFDAAREALTAYEASRAALSAMQPRDEAALADLALDYLHLAQPEFCSARCPSVGREGEPIPHLPECVSMRSLLDGLPFATPGATISTGLMAKLKKLANYLTEQGEYEACDLIDTVVDRLSASPPTPARDEGLEALLELSERATKGEWRPGRSDMMSSCGGCDMTFKNIYVDDPRGGVHKPTNSPLGLTVAKAVSELIGAESEIAMPDEEVFANAALIAAAVNYVRNKLAQEPRK